MDGLVSVCLLFARFIDTNLSSKQSSEQRRRSAIYMLAVVSRAWAGSGGK
jgi:hypothetical protein